jgi:hypothetical protein
MTFDSNNIIQMSDGSSQTSICSVIRSTLPKDTDHVLDRSRREMLGHDLSGGDLEAVRKAMEDPKRFPVAAAPARRSGSR